MGAIKAQVTRHPVRTYFALAFAISWGGMLAVIGGPGALPASPEELDRLKPLVWAAYVAGPTVASVLLTALVSGRQGLSELVSRVVRWRVGARWYGIALLTAPLPTLAIFLGLSLRSPDFVPVIFTVEAKLPLLLAGMAAAVGGGFAEELGWTGFAIPRMRRHHGVLASGVIVGVLWGAWHLLVNVWFSATLSGGLSLPVFLTVYFLAGVAQLTAYRVLMVWIYDRTESVLVATIMHGALILSTVAFVPATTGVAFLEWFLAFTAAIWVFVAAVAVGSRGHLLTPTTRSPAAANRSA